MVGEPLAAEVGLVQPLGLDHGAHGAVDDEDALREEPLEGPLALRCRAGWAGHDLQFTSRRGYAPSSRERQRVIDAPQM